MNELKFNKKSWHYFLASTLAGYRAPTTFTFYDGYVETTGDSADICTYSKHVVGGAVICLAIGCAIAFFGFLVWSIIFGIYFSILAGALVFNDWASATIILLAVLLTGAAIVATINYIAEKIRLSRMKAEPSRHQPSFATQAYRSWKGKYCAKIKFED